MTTFRLRRNRPGHWDIFADGTTPPVMTFDTFDEALNHMLDLANARTCHMHVVIEFDEPGRSDFVQKGFFSVQRDSA